MTKRLFVGNLSFDISETQLQDAFAPYGSTGATIPTRANGRPKGFGFVDVPETKAAAAIGALQGTELDGRALAIHEAKPKPEVSYWGNGGGRPYSGYGGRGGYGGGGRGPGYGGRR